MRGNLRQLFKPKHPHAELHLALEGVFGSKRFGDWKCRLVIPTDGAIGGRVFVMKTAHHERFRHGLDAPAVDVAMATSAAPTCFSAAPFPQHANASRVDGGVWANCPVLAGGRLQRMNATAKAGEFALGDARPARIDQPLSPVRAHAVQAENLTAAKTRFLNGLTGPEFRPPVSPAQGQTPRAELNRQGLGTIQPQQNVFGALVAAVCVWAQQAVSCLLSLVPSSRPWPPAPRPEATPVAHRPGRRN